VPPATKIKRASAKEDRHNPQPTATDTSLAERHRDSRDVGEERQIAQQSKWRRAADLAVKRRAKEGDALGLGIREPEKMRRWERAAAAW
jgi:hypothetical protein